MLAGWLAGVLQLGGLFSAEVQIRAIVAVGTAGSCKFPLVSPPRYMQDKGALATQAGLAAYASLPLEALSSSCRVLFLIRECDAAHANVTLLNTEASRVQNQTARSQPT